MSSIQAQLSYVQLYLNNVLFITKMYEQFRQSEYNIIIIEETFYLKSKDGLYIKKCVNTNNNDSLIFDILKIVKYIDDKNDIVELILSPNIMFNKDELDTPYGSTRSQIIRVIAQYYFNKKNVN